MYNEFFGFREKPFNVTPDPRFFYANSAYEEAYASLVYGIQERKGFISLIGETGTGKTTLLRRVMASLAEPNHFVYLCYSTPSFEEFLTFICSDLGLEVEGKGYLGKIQTLNNFLLTSLQQGGTGILLVDEAQNIGETVLENLRLLSNLETATEKLLQIVLVGQPELEKKLARPNLRQLKQRIAVQCRLDRLKEREVGPFIFSRLRTIGYEQKELFPPESIHRIALYSRGTPRLVNIICDNALLITYSISQKVVTPEIIDEVARDLQLRSEGILQERETVRPVAWQGAEKRMQEKEETLSAPWEVSPKVEGYQAEGPTSPSSPWVPVYRKRGNAFRIGLGALLAFLLLPALGVRPENIKDILQQAFSFWRQMSAQITTEPNTATKIDPRSPEQLPNSVLPPLSLSQPSRPSSPPDALAEQPVPSTQEPEGTKNKIGMEQKAGDTGPESREKQNPFVIVQSGTTISEIVQKTYGSLNILAVDLVKEFNPSIRDLDHIQAGEKVWLPPLNRETLLRKKTDGSYQLVLASFRSLGEAEKFSQKVRDRGFSTKVSPQRISTKILLQRVEIEDLPDLDAVNRAWELVDIRGVLVDSLPSNLRAGTSRGTVAIRPPVR